MARALKPADNSQAASLDAAVNMLRAARDELARADCPRSLARVRAALKSAEGARRHMQRRSMHSTTVQP